MCLLAVSATDPHYTTEPVGEQTIANRAVVSPQSNNIQLGEQPSWPDTVHLSIRDCTENVIGVRGERRGHGLVFTTGSEWLEPAVARCAELVREAARFRMGFEREACVPLDTLRMRSFGPQHEEPSTGVQLGP